MTLGETQAADKLPLTVERIRVRPDRIETLIRVSDECFASTDEQVIAYVLKICPTVGLHACRNHKGRLFSDVMSNTSTPHLLEHMVVDGQTRQSKDETRVFTGTTQWMREDSLLAKLVFSYEDDLVALEVLKDCVRVLNDILLAQRVVTANH